MSSRIPWTRVAQAIDSGFDWLFGDGVKPDGETQIVPSAELATALATHSIWIETAESALRNLQGRTERLRAELERRAADSA